MPFEYAWMMLAADASEIELECFLDLQKPWKKKKSQHEPCQVCPVRTDSHTMQYVIYECHSVTCAALSHIQPCQWHVKSRMCDNAKRGSIEQHGAHHTEFPDPPVVRLNLTMKRFIRQKVEDKLKPSRILNGMIDQGFFSEHAAAYLPFVQRYAYHYRTTAMHDNNNVDEMEALLASRPYNSSLDETIAFAFGYRIGANGAPALQTGTEERPVVFGFTSKRLLHNLSFAADHVLHVDATFKLNTASFPAIVIGVSDVRRQFHPVSFFITSDIKQPQMESVLRATFRQYHDVTGEVARVKYVMADADVGQRNAIELMIVQELGVGSRPVFLMCFFHVMQNVKKYLANVPVTSRQLAVKHVYCIHYARTALDLDRRIDDAVKAWKEDAGCQDFERRFSQQWLVGRFTQWQCLSTPPGFAKTNNPVETFNKEIKRDYSLRTLLSVNGLAQSLLDLCHHRSCRVKPFATTTQPSEDQARRYKSLEKANRLAVSSWSRSSILFLTEGVDRRIFRVIQSGRDIPKVKKTPAATLNEEIVASEREVEVDGQPSSGWLVDLDNNFCDCRSWFKFGYCVHVIACRIQQDLEVQGVSGRRKFATKGRKQGTGRRGQVGHALSLE